MERLSEKPIRCEQLLFGYDEGHRLLAASTKLHQEAANLLLLHSDLALGLPSNAFKSYLTGIPVVSLKSYALIKTWPAPEMPRPGCVWSHVLLINFADLGRAINLDLLLSLFKRPESEAVESMVKYNQALFTSVEATPHFRRDLDFDKVRFVLRAAYVENEYGILPSSRLNYDKEIIAVWAQQWPRLRRSFSFRTAALPPHRVLIGHKNFRYDLQLMDGSARDPSMNHYASPLPNWEELAVEDILAPNDLRVFLNKFGNDQKRGKQRFRTLIEIYSMCKSLRNSSSSLTGELLAFVAELIPDPSDGISLKSCLVGLNDEPVSLDIDPVEVIYFFVSNPELSSAFPELSESIFERAVRGWVYKKGRILEVAEQALLQKSKYSEILVGQLSEVVKPGNFLTNLRFYPLVRDAVLLRRHDLLDNESIVDIEPSLIISFINSSLRAENAEGFSSRLIHLSDERIARAFIRKFPAAAERALLTAAASYVQSGGSLPPKSWAVALASQRPKGFAGSLLSLSRRTTELAACALIFDRLLGGEFNADAKLWARSWSMSVDDLRGDGRIFLLVFLLKLAITDPKSGVEPIFEIAFDEVHSSLATNQIKKEAQQEMETFLPDLNWWEQWDLCLRLRLAVVAAYLGGNLEPTSFYALSRSSLLRDEMLELASDFSRKGKKLSKLARTLSY